MRVGHLSNRQPAVPPSLIGSAIALIDSPTPVPLSVAPTDESGERGATAAVPLARSCIDLA